MSNEDKKVKSLQDKLVEIPRFVVGGKSYVNYTFEGTLGEFLIKNQGKEIYVYTESIGTGEIRAIVAENQKIE